MPDTDSLVLIRNILALKPRSKILMLSMNSEEIYAKRYLQAGAMGYVKKDAPTPDIKNAITTVLANKKYISEVLKEKLLNDLNDKKNSANPFDNLSAREFEIAHHLIRGDSLGDICAKLDLKSSTVSTFKARIFEKMHCSNVIELNTLAKLHNVIQ
jgi:DNA-binding NarL/FixJ family response regulator